MGALTFTVPGPPVPWARSRQRGRAHFTDPKVTRHALAVSAAARAAGVRVVPKPGRVGVDLVLFLPRPKRGKYAHPIDRRDVDNLAKLCLDALNGVAYEDDGQVCSLGVRKFYEHKTQEPATFVTVRALDEGDG